jgi:ATP-dependent helicase HrpA
MLQQSDKDQQKMQEMARFQQWYWQSIENRQKDESDQLLSNITA